jgi:GNAT superfamily N-acetyltransferase
MIATEEQVIIRACKNEDVPACLELVKEFHEEVINDFGFGFDPVHSVTFALSQVAGCFVAELDGKIIGLIAGAVLTYPISGEKMYMESIWYVRKEHRRHGLKLLRRLEEWCREQGIKNVVMALMCSDKMKKLEDFYKACGYRPFEMQWVKNLN